MSEEMEPICAECGHGKSCHVVRFGGICVGCPCGEFKLKVEPIPAPPQEPSKEQP